MSAGVFVIQELRRVGGVLIASQDPDGGERFEWVAGTRGEAGQGAWAAPRKPWDIGGSLRTAKTWYGGAKTPSEQVQGPAFEDQQFRGNLDDRYNFAGFALDVKRRFEAMCERGNFVRITFQQEAWEGLITKWNMQYQRAWDIPYTFTISVHGRPEDRSLADRSPPTLPSTSQVFDQVDVTVQSMLDTHNDVNTGDLADDLADRSLARLSTIATARDGFADVLDQRDFAGNASNGLRQLATRLRTIHAGAFDLVGELEDVRADTDVVTRSALRVLSFEGWSRSLRYQARLLGNQARISANDLEERIDGRAERLYEPRAGELLYAVSTRFYGTPFAWDIIADRNRLRSIVLTGTELLVIPERGNQR